MGRHGSNGLVARTVRWPVLLVWGEVVLIAWPPGSCRSGFPGEVRPRIPLYANPHLRCKPTPFAGANRSRFEGLRRTALSALLGRSPIVVEMTLLPRRARVVRTGRGTRGGEGVAYMGTVGWRLFGTAAAVRAGASADPLRRRAW